RLPHGEEPFPVAGHPVGPAHVRGAVRLRLGDLAQLQRGAGRRRRPAGDPELVVPRRGDERAWTPAAGHRFPRHLDLQFLEGGPDRAAALRGGAMKLTDRVAIVAGTSPNIGGGLAEALAAEGTAIVAVDAREANARDCASYIARNGGRALAVT